MQYIGTSGPEPRSTNARPKVAIAVVVAVAFLFSLLGASQGFAQDGSTVTQASGPRSVWATGQARTRTGFIKPFSGLGRYQRFAPKKITRSRQMNLPIGQKKADRIARRLGLRKSKTFTRKQFRKFVSGRGVGGNKADAKLVDASVRILTNTVGRPLYSKINGRRIPSVLASYGLMVNRKGQLESPANTDAPTRQVNSVLAPGGYLGTWARANGAKAALRRLYRSAYTVEAVYGNKSQQQSGVAQLVRTNKRGIRAKVGMSMAPSLWLVNFLLIYTLNPKLAAKMPARWAPIPRKVARAIAKSPTGQVPYKRYARFLR